MNVFKQLWKSLYSPKDIAAFRFQGIGKTILFLFILALVSLVPVMIQVTQLGSSIFSEGEDLLLKELPDFEVQEGKLVSQSDKPVTARSSGFTVIVDDTGEIQPGDISNSPNTIALLRDHAVVSTGPEIQEYPYSMFTGFTFSTDGIASLLSSLDGAKIIIYSVIFFVMFVISIGLLLIKVFIFGAVGLLFAKTLQKRLSYRHSFRLSAYSMTLPTIFFMIVPLIGSTIPAANLVNWLVTSIILYLAIKEIPSRKPRTA